MKRLELVCDLGVIRQNAVEIKRRVPDKGAKFLCVVKADAYGHGAVRVAGALEGIADAFAVATPSEGAELRQSGIADKPIVVLGNISEYEDALISVKYGLRQAVDSVEDARALDAAAKEAGKQALIHIKTDTGMSRIGVKGEEALISLLDGIKGLKGARVDGVFTHFCAADED